MENKALSLTEEIYAELVDGLKTGLDWTAFIAKHSASKGPLYNAIGRFFNDMETEVIAANEKLSLVQRELDEAGLRLDQAGLRLDQLDQEIREADKAVQAKNHNLALLEEKENTLKKQMEVLESNLEQKSDLLAQLQGLEKLGFGEESFKALHTTLVEIGTKRGLKPSEAVNTFFTELKDYDAKTGFEREIQRLETIIRTQTLEAEKWQAEADSLLRRHKELSEGIAAVQSLTKHGVKAEQIISWSGIVSKLGGPEELQDRLEQYKSMSELLTAKTKEIDGCDKKVTELSAQIKALNEQKAEIEGAIKSLSSSGVKEITKVSDKAITELKSLLAEIRVETKRLADLKAEVGKLEKELMYARYLTTGDQAVLKSFPKEVVIAFLDRASVYCKLNQLNPLVRVPDGFSRKYSSISSYAEIGLLDLITWAEAGLAGAS